MLSLTILVAMVIGVYSYGTGPPSSKCDDMFPGHNVPTQSTIPPYTLNISKTTYSPNEQLRVTLSGSSFKGFMIQARPSVDDFTTFGTFAATEHASNPCSVGKVAVAHTDDDIKTSLTFDWTAPSTNVGNIVFVYTVVQAKTIYWVKQSIDPITFSSSGGGGGGGQPTQAPITTSKPTVTGTINRDTACEVSKSCFPSQAECSSNCNYLVTWHTVGSDDVEFTLTRKTTSTNNYMAIGLSADPKMGADSVVQCVAKDNSVDVFASYNSGKNNVLLDNPKFGISAVTGSQTNGILSCTFRRKKDSTLATAAATGRRKRAATDGTTFFSLNTMWYLLVALGSPGSATGTINQHSTQPVISSSKINFLEQLADPGTTTPAPPALGTVTKDKRCGDTLGCFSDCEGDSCSFLFTWKDEGNDVIMDLCCKKPGNTYCAIGLSGDEEMGDDSVMACVANNGVAEVTLSYNNGRENVELDNKKFGLSNMTTSQKDGVLCCQFYRKKTYTLASAATRQKREAATASTYFDLNSDWKLLYANGGAIGGYVSKHATLPTVSSQTADFQSFQDISATGTDKSLVKAHGILMVLAWMFFAVLGIFMPMFYKPMWAQQGQEWFGQKRWFVIHRSCMVLVFLLTAAAFIIIFVEVKGYAEIDGSRFQKSHPIIGIVVMALTCINPIMALFRPHPNTPRRPIFNVAHKVVGQVAQSLSIINLFSGTLLSAVNLPSYIRIILFVFVGWIVAINIILYLYECCQNKEGQSGAAYEMKDMAENNGRSNRSVTQIFKLVILPLHILVVCGFMIAVAVIIGQAE